MAQLGTEKIGGGPDLSWRAYFSYFGKSPRFKWALPVGLFFLGRAVWMWGAVTTLLLVASMLAVGIPLGYLLWRGRGGGPDPDY